MDRPQQLDDGSHLIPIHRIRCAGCESHPAVTGSVRWSPERGTTFEIDLPAVSQAELPRYYRVDDARVGCGRFMQPSTEARWTAETSAGLPVRLYATQETPSYETHYGTHGSGFSSRIAGKATFVEVHLPKNDPLAFWGPIESAQRFFLVGFGSRHWTTTDRVSYLCDSAVVTMNRCSLLLSDISTVRIVGAGPRVCLPLGAWLECDTSDAEDPFTYPRSTDRSFISFLTGRRIPFLWHDTLISDSILRRVYFGWNVVDLEEITESHTQPLPLHDSIEALRFSREVVGQLPALYERYRDLNECFEFEWILHPIWTANRGVMDDRLALVSVSLERLATEWSNLKKTRDGISSRAHEIWKDERIGGIRDRLSQALEEAIAESRLSSDSADDSEQTIASLLRKRIQNIAQSPNADRLVGVFMDLGMVLTVEEKKAIGNRNRALHGARTLRGFATADFDVEAERFDTIRILITKALLKLLRYRGPYINYVARPDQGNFPVERLESP